MNTHCTSWEEEKKKSLFCSTGSLWGFFFYPVQAFLTVPHLVQGFEVVCCVCRECNAFWGKWYLQTWDTQITFDWFKTLLTKSRRHIVPPFIYRIRDPPSLPETMCPQRAVSALFLSLNTQQAKSMFCCTKEKCWDIAKANNSHTVKH